MPRTSGRNTDVWSRQTVYRVFLLESTLQVDIAFAPAEEFGALGPTFQLLFGEAMEQPAWSTPSPVDLVGMGWLYALHARSSIARGKAWQAEYMISGVRDHVLMLMCLAARRTALAGAWTAPVAISHHGGRGADAGAVAGARGVAAGVPGQCRRTAE